MKILQVDLLLMMVACTNAANILGIICLPSRSHNIWNRSLMTALASRGHDVTVITAFQEKNNLPNYKEIVIKELEFTDLETSEMVSMSPFQFVDLFAELNVQMCKDVFSAESTKKFLQLVKSIKFDLIIADVTGLECIFGFVHVLNNPPLIGVTAYSHPLWISYMTGNPHNPSYVPDLTSSFSDHMNFREKMLNTVYHLYSVVKREWSYMPAIDTVVREFFGDDVPPIGNIKNNVSLVMINTHNSFDHPRPLVPAIVEVGGMHIGPSQPLPKHLKTVMDEAKGGFIYFSLGSFIRSDKLPSDRRQVFLDSFSKLPYKVFWKWESESLPGQPSNVIVGKWMPQRDILAHPNIRLFITHNGLLSTQEAIYNGVPTVGVPFFADQQVNAAKSIAKGFGERIDFSTVTANELLTTIQKVINDNRYKENAVRLSQLMRDQPQTPLERAIFWTEYVIRHKGAPHLRSAAVDLPWYQYLLLDVVSVLVVGVLLVLLLLYKICCFLISLVFHRGSPSKQKKH